MRCPPSRGFTLPELIAVMVIIGVLAVAVMPKFDVAVNLRADTYRDQVVAALRLAGSHAASHRRLVCASVGTGSVSLSIAAANPATACSSALPGAGGGATATAAGNSTSSISPAGTLYFQPSGRITGDAAGVSAGSWTISIGGATAITVTGETGHVE